MKSKGSSKILILCSLANSLISFRRDLISHLIANNYKVFAAAPEISKHVCEELDKMGAIPIEYKLQRTGLNPWKDLNSILTIKKIIVEYKIDILFPYTIKPVIYGSFVGQITGVPVVSLITGLGFTFSKSSIKARILQNVSEILYRITLRKNSSVIFQNSDDLALFKQKRLLTKTQMAYIVDGSGINLKKYSFRENNNPNNRTVFIFVARLIREKGAELFMDAAKELKGKFPKTEFHIIGSPDYSPSSISVKELKDLHERKIIIYHGFQKEVAPFLASADVFVLPTYYREGVPRSILEALSIGLPIITTNTPGCKETVIQNRNGILIEPNRLNPLIAALRFFIENPDKIHDMGIESRKLAEKRFDVRIINENILEILNDVLQPDQ